LTADITTGLCHPGWFQGWTTLSDQPR